jgi:UDP-2,3-diacylglucosamine pyrophosphatase LpxH
MYAPDPFERCDETSLDLRLAGRPAHLAHGDLVNRRDHQYRAWRAVSKNRLAFAAFNLIPLRRRARLVDDLERGMATTNMKARGGFPMDECLNYARARLRRGTEILVFGHFHEERRIAVEEGGRRGTVYVLPAWRAGHRYLRIDPGVEPAFVSA